MSGLAFCVVRHEHHGLALVLARRRTLVTVGKDGFAGRMAMFDFFSVLAYCLLSRGSYSLGCLVLEGCNRFEKDKDNCPAAARRGAIQ